MSMKSVSVGTHPYAGSQKMPLLPPQKDYVIYSATASKVSLRWISLQDCSTVVLEDLLTSGREYILQGLDGSFPK